MNQNPVALLTGSAKRLGACTARTLHHQGYNIILHCHHSVTDAEQLCQQLNDQRADSCHWLQADLCNPEQLVTLARDAINLYSRLDVLVNNASSFYPTPVGSITMGDWHALVGSNMQAPLFLSQHCQKQLKQNQGVIINMVDIHAEKPLKDHTVYCMAKSALVMMTQSLAKELAPDIRVNGVAPGAILWPENELGETEKQHIIDQIPMAALGTPQDIADTINFLIHAPYITGQIIAVDGGRSLGGNAKA